MSAPVENTKCKQKQKITSVSYAVAEIEDCIIQCIEECLESWPWNMTVVGIVLDEVCLAADSPKEIYNAAAKAASTAVIDKTGYHVDITCDSEAADPTPDGLQQWLYDQAKGAKEGE